MITVGSTYRKVWGLAQYRKSLSRERCSCEHTRLWLKKNEKTSSLIFYRFPVWLGAWNWGSCSRKLYFLTAMVFTRHLRPKHFWSSDPHLKMRIISLKFFCMEILSKGEIQQLNKKPRQGSKPFPSKISSPTSKEGICCICIIHKALCFRCFQKRKKTKFPLQQRVPPENTKFPLLPSRATWKNPAAPSFYPT